MSSSARDGCDCGGGPTLSHVASVTGSFSEPSNALSLSYRLASAKSPVDVKFVAKLNEADPHARAAFVGTYSVADKEGRIGMEGGACVLWQYAGTKRE